MARIAVAGLVNLETTLQVEQFPIVYNPVNYRFFGIASAVSGVGWNVARALHELGNEVSLLSFVGSDLAGEQVRDALRRAGLADRDVLEQMGQTCQSVVQYDREGRRQIYTDLKDIQEQTYPQERCERAASEADLCVVCNINFARGLLGPARRAGKPVATDVHAIADLDAPYEQEFLQGADIIFMSNEHLPKIPEEWANAVLARFPAEIVVIGLGAEGALLATRRDGLVRLPAVQTRAVVNTIGAGDALFAGFLDGYLRTKDPYASLRRAMVFASWKIGVASAGAGFADCDTLERIMANFADRQ